MLIPGGGADGVNDTFPVTAGTGLGSAAGCWVGMVGVPSGVPGAEGAELSEAVVVVTGDKVARWQNLIPSFPWITPGWRVWGAIQGKEGIKFCSVA